MDGAGSDLFQIVGFGLIDMERLCSLFMIIVIYSRLRGTDRLDASKITIIYMCCYETNSYDTFETICARQNLMKSYKKQTSLSPQSEHGVKF